MLEAYELAADAFTSTAEERAAEPEAFWAKRIADPSGLSAAFGAFEGQELIGTVALEFAAKPKTKHKALVIGMYVTPGARSTGAGRAGSSSFHMEIRPVTPTWWWSPVELVGSRRPVVGRVGNPQGCPSGHPQESASGAQSGSLRKLACPQIHRTFH